MKFLEIKEGLSVECESILAIEMVESSGSYTGYKTIVHTKAGVFESSFPYQTILDLLNKDEEKEVETSAPQQYWAG